MTKTRTASIYHEERAWFFAALALVLIVFSAYAYLVSASVVHVVMRKEFDREISRTSSYVSQLEARYIDAQHTVSERVATLEGYARTDEKVFIEKAPTSLVLSTNNGS